MNVSSNYCVCVLFFFSYVSWNLLYLLHHRVIVILFSIQIFLSVITLLCITAFRIKKCLSLGVPGCLRTLNICLWLRSWSGDPEIKPWVSWGGVGGAQRGVCFLSSSEPPTPSAPPLAHAFSVSFK